MVQRYGFRVIYDTKSNFEAKVDFVLKDKTWNWKPTKLYALVTIQGQLFFVELEDKDKVIWQITISKKFSYSTTYATTILWWQLLWLHLTIPKHCLLVG